MKYIKYLPIFFIIFVAACKTPKNTAGDKQPKREYLEDLTCTPPFDDKELFSAKQADPVPVDSVYIEGDCLHVLTGKMNVCDANRIKLAWNGALMKSMPPQANMGFLVDKDPDCKEEYKFHLSYSLKLMRMRNIGNKIVLRIKGTTQAVTYNFVMD